MGQVCLGETLTCLPKANMDERTPGRTHIQPFARVMCTVQYKLRKISNAKRDKELTEVWKIVVVKHL